MNFGKISLYAPLFVGILSSGVVRATDSESERKKQASTEVQLSRPADVSESLYAAVIAKGRSGDFEQLLRKEKVSDTRLLGKLLVLAATHNMFAKVCQLLQLNADVNATVEGECALTQAVRNYSFSSARWILDTRQVDLGHVVEAEVHIGRLFLRDREKIASLDETDKKELASMRAKLREYPDHAATLRTKLDCRIADIRPIQETPKEKEDWFNSMKTCIRTMPLLALSRRLPIVRAQAAKALRDSDIHSIETELHKAYMEQAFSYEPAAESKSESKGC